jgi:hypothetical protein
MVNVKIRVAHALRPRHLTKCRVRSELAVKSTEALKKNAERLQIRNQLRGRRTTAPLVHFRPCLESVWPWHRNPKSHPLKKRRLRPLFRWADKFFAQRGSKGVAQMAYHLSSRHAPPAGQSIWLDLRKSVEYPMLIPNAQKSLHRGIFYPKLYENLISCQTRNSQTRQATGHFRPASI